MGSRGRSIQWKVFALVFGLTIAITALFVLVLPWVELRDARRAQDDHALAYAQMASAGLESAVAFDDVETARELLEPLSSHSDILGVSLLGDDGVELYGAGVLRVPPAWPPDLENYVLQNGDDDVVVTAPIVAREGKVGLVVVRVSTEQLGRASANILKASLAAMGVALLLGFGAARLIGSSLTRRLRVLTKSASRVADGDIEVSSLADRSGDEVGELGRAFDVMVTQLKGVVEIREGAAREEERARAATARNRDLRLVLDNVSDGLLIVEADGRICAEHSAVVETWFGPLALDEGGHGPRFWSFIASHDAAIADWMEASWAMLEDGFMPVDAALDQMPKLFVRSGSTFQLRIAPVVGTTRYLIALLDVTEEQRRRSLEAEERAMAAAVAQLLHDKDAFVAFVGEARAMVAEVAASASATDRLRRTVHTLKGNFSILGFDELADLCHRLETDLEMGAAPRGSDGFRTLEARWAKIEAMVGSLTDTSQQAASVDRRDIAALERAIVSGAPRGQTLELVRTLGFESAARRLARIADQTQELATKSGGNDVEARAAKTDLRLDARGLAPFWSAFTHVVRNALSHGIESPDERLGRGKPARGSIEVSADLEGGSLVVRVADDGRGVDWIAVREAAVRRGLPSDTHADLVGALFAAQLSTKTEIDSLSGRGEGLGAVREVVQRLGGAIDVETTRGQGTTFIFRLPARFASLPSKPTSSERGARATV